MQYGRPTFVFGPDGQKHYEPNVSVIRHLYFDSERENAGEALLAQTSSNLVDVNALYAFYHILGMSCSAYYGKLHNSQVHVEQLLQRRDFKIKHENVYYKLDMGALELPFSKRLKLRAHYARDEGDFDVQLDRDTVGIAEVRYLGALTDGCTRDTAYLTWIRVHEQHRGRGVGSDFVRLLAAQLLSMGYRYLHTHTAGENIGAQRFYERRGFEQQGYTRSYVRTYERA